MRGCCGLAAQYELREAHQIRTVELRMKRNRPDAGAVRLGDDFHHLGASAMTYDRYIPPLGFFCSLHRADGALIVDTSDQDSLGRALAEKLFHHGPRRGFVTAAIQMLNGFLM
jgi:hypothetical protein